MSWNQDNIQKQCENFLAGKINPEGYWSHPRNYPGDYGKDHPLIAETFFTARDFPDKQAE